MTDKIILNGIEVMGRHGCTEAERENEQLFIVDAELYLDLSLAGKSDDINDTIDYPQVIVDIKKIVGGKSRVLIEAVAQEIAETLLRKYFRLNGLKIVLTKVNPPIPDSFAGAAVQIVRSRLDT